MMRKSGHIDISGKKLRAIRLRHGLTQFEFAVKIGLTVRRIQQIEQKEMVGMFLPALRAVAEFQKVPIEKTLLELSANAIEEPGLTLSTPVPVPDIPTFDLAVAAGPWAEVAEVGELQGDKGLMDGRFRINIGGDSMEPDYPKLAMVEFRCVRWSLDPLQVGEDYYVQVDQHATFKRLEEASDEELIFRAVNRRKYPKAIPVRTSEIIHMARAEFIITRVKRH